MNRAVVRKLDRSRAKSTLGPSCSTYTAAPATKENIRQIIDRIFADPTAAALAKKLTDGRLKGNPTIQEILHAILADAEARELACRLTEERWPARRRKQIPSRAR
jgi:hypothetical protein